MPLVGFETWHSAMDIEHVTVTPLHHGKCLTNTHYIFVLSIQIYFTKNKDKSALCQ